MTESNNGYNYNNYIFWVLIALVVIIPLYLFFRTEYHYQNVDLERIEKIKLSEDIPTIWDYQPEGMTVDWNYHETDWRGQTSIYLETLSTRHNSSKTDVSMTLYRSRERAAEGYLFLKRSRDKSQYEKAISPNDAYCISRVKRLREPHFAGLLKSGQYISEVVIIKNNLIVDVTSYYDKTGSGKQIMIDTIADYLEKYAARENANN